jgi:dihydropyrimidinase
MRGALAGDLLPWVLLSFAAHATWVLPGGIDSHVHIAQPSGEGIVMTDSFESATRSAAIGGNTTVLPFCLQENGTPLRETLKAYHAQADGECYTDVSFHLIISQPDEQLLGQDLPALVADGYTSFKIFITYEGLALSDLDILRVMSVHARPALWSWYMPKITTSSVS